MGIAICRGNLLSSNELVYQLFTVTLQIRPEYDFLTVYRGENDIPWKVTNPGEDQSVAMFRGILHPEEKLLIVFHKGDHMFNEIVYAKNCSGSDLTPELNNLAMHINWN